MRIIIALVIFLKRKVMVMKVLYVICSLFVKVKKHRHYFLVKMMIF